MGKGPGKPMHGGGPSGDCVFCQIVRRETPAHILYEDSDTIAFLDLFPLSRGHSLVIPKRHWDRITELPPDQYPRLFAALAEVCRRVERLTYHYNVGINQGSLAGQIVFHLHFHVIPRYENDGTFQGPRRRERLGNAEALRVLRDLGVREAAQES